MHAQKIVQLAIFLYTEFKESEQRLLNLILCYFFSTLSIWSLSLNKKLSFTIVTLPIITNLNWYNTHLDKFSIRFSIYWLKHNWPYIFLISHGMHITEAAPQRCSKKQCFENMLEIYRRTPITKCNFNQVTKQLYWNHTLAWVFSCKHLLLRTPLGSCWFTWLFFTCSH